MSEIDFSGTDLREEEIDLTGIDFGEIDISGTEAPDYPTDKERYEQERLREAEAHLAFMESLSKVEATELTEKPPFKAKGVTRAVSRPHYPAEDFSFDRYPILKGPMGAFFYARPEDPWHKQVGRSLLQAVAATDKMAGGFLQSLEELAPGPPIDDDDPELKEMVEWTAKKYNIAPHEAARWLEGTSPAIRGEDIARRAQKKIEELEPYSYPGSAKDVVGNAIISTAHNLAWLLPSLAVRNPALGRGLALTGMGTSVYGDEYFNLRDRGETIFKSSLGALGYGTTEVLTEFIPVGGYLRPSKGLVNRMAQSLVEEVPTESLNEVVNMVQDKLLFNKGTPMSEAIARIKDTIIQTALSAPMIGAGIHVGQTVSPRGRSFRMDNLRAIRATIEDMPRENKAQEKEYQKAVRQISKLTKKAYIERIQSEEGIAEKPGRVPGEAGYTIEHPVTGEELVVTDVGKVGEGAEMADLASLEKGAQDYPVEFFEEVEQGQIEFTPVRYGKQTKYDINVGGEFIGFMSRGKWKGKPRWRINVFPRYEAGNNLYITQSFATAKNAQEWLSRPENLRGMMTAVSARNQIKNAAYIREAEKAANELIDLAQVSENDRTDGQKERIKEIEKVLGKPTIDIISEFGSPADALVSEINSYLGKEPADVQGMTADDTAERRSSTRWIAQIRGIDPVRGLDDPVRRANVLSNMIKAFDIPIYEGGMKRKKGGRDILGYYKRRIEVLRIKDKNDLATAAHEVAHLLDDRFNPEIRALYKNPKYGMDLANTSSYGMTGGPSEGFAEFVRLWMTEEVEAKRRSPGFYDAWEAWVEKSPYKSIIRQTKADMLEWFNQDPILRAKSKMGPEEPINKAFDSLYARGRQSMFDDLHGIMAAELELFGKIMPGGAYETARLTRATHSIADGSIRFGVPILLERGDIGIKKGSLGLMQILEQTGSHLEDFLTYAVGMSALELKTQGRENLFSGEEIEAMLSQEREGFARVFQQYQDWNNGIVDFAESLGIIDPVARQAWKRTFYLPFFREGRPFKNTGGNLWKIPGYWNGIRKLTGGTGNIRDALTNMVDNATRLIGAGLKNQARMKVVEFSGMARGGHFLEEVPKEVMPDWIDKQQIRRFVYKTFGLRPSTVRDIKDVEDLDPRLKGFIDGVEKVFAKAPDFVRFWQYGQTPKAPNVVAVMYGGKPKYFQVGDPVLYRSLVALDRPAMHPYVRWLNIPKKIGQASVTIAVEFIEANIARDQLAAAIFSKVGYVPFKDAARGMWARIANDENYKAYVMNGGGLSSYFIDEGSIRRKIERYKAERGLTKSVIDTPVMMFDFLNTVADYAESATRIGEFTKAVRKGHTARHAAYLSREVSTDFAMRGDSKIAGFFYDTVMFLKPGMNGLDRVYRGFAVDENRAHVAMKTATLAMLATALYLHNRDNPCYQQLPGWDRDSYFHFFVQTGADDEPCETKYKHYRYPKMWELGAIASVSERTMELMLPGLLKHLYGDKYSGEFDPAAADFQLYAKSLTDIFINMFHVSVVPTLAAPFVTQYLGEKPFVGTPIEAQWMKQFEPYQRYQPYQPNIYRDIAHLTRNLPEELQISPARLEVFLRGYFNTWATYGSMLSNAFYDDAMPLRSDQNPLTRRFYTKEPAQRTRYEQEVYDLYGELSRIRRTLYKIAEEDQDINLFQEQLVRKGLRLADLNKLDDVVDKLSKYRSEMKAIAIADIPKSLKDSERDRILGEKNQMLRMVHEDMRRKMWQESKEEEEESAPIDFTGIE